MHAPVPENEIPTIFIMDVLGQKLTSVFHGSNGRFTTDVSALKAGIYFLQLQWKEGQAVERFVKE